jgi:hypothetical protein
MEYKNKKIKKQPRKAVFLMVQKMQIKLETILSLLLITIPAINRSVIVGLERHLSFDTAFSTDNSVHFPVSAGVSVTLALPGGAALRTSGGIILKTFFCVEFLFGNRENEFSTTIFAR